MPESQVASSGWLRAPQSRISAHFGQLAEGHEGDQWLLADQPGPERPGELAAVQPGGDVGVEDDRVLGRRSGQVAVALGVGEGQEVFQFLIRLECVCRQVIQ